MYMRSFEDIDAFTRDIDIIMRLIKLSELYEDNKRSKTFSCDWLKGLFVEIKQHMP